MARAKKTTDTVVEELNTVVNDQVFETKIEAKPEEVLVETPAEDGVEENAQKSENVETVKKEKITTKSTKHVENTIFIPSDTHVGNTSISQTWIG